MTMASNELLSLARPLVEILLADGFALSEICERCDFVPEGLHTPGQTISIQGFDELWRLAYASRGETVGLQAAQLIKIVDVQELGLLLASTNCVEDGLRAICRYAELITELVDITMEKYSDGLVMSVEHQHRQGDRLVRLDNTAVLSRTFIAHYLDSPLMLSRVELTRSEPEDSRAWQQALAAPIQWGAPVTRVYISAEQAAREVVTRNPQICSSLRLILDSRLDQRRKHRPLQQIKLEIIRQLQCVKPTVDTVASALNMSQRSLQRCLQEEVTSFSDLLSESRHHLAVHYLECGMEIDEISDLLGYSDKVAFHRAFKRWTGQTPKQFRTP